MASYHDEEDICPDERERVVFTMDNKARIFDDIVITMLKDDEGYYLQVMGGSCIRVEPRAANSIHIRLVDKVKRRRDKNGQG